jgi:hypothetical protein
MHCTDYSSLYSYLGIGGGLQIMLMVIAYPIQLSVIEIEIVASSRLVRAYDL